MVGKVLAACTPGSGIDLKECFPSVTKFGTLGDLTNVIVRNAFILAGVISFILLIFGGFSIIVGSGAGDTKKIEQGRQAMVGAVFGLIIVIASVWVVQIVEKVTGLSLLNP